MRIGTDDISHLERQPPYDLRVLAAHAISDRPAHRRAQLKRRDTADYVGKLLAQSRRQSRPYLLTCANVLGHDHRMSDELVRQRRLQRQIESHGAPPYVER